jgi:myo-inositol-1(or 4)-monophosphatase
MLDLAALLPALTEVLAEAGKLAQTERERLQPKLKPDGSIVTNGDLAIEDLVRERTTKLLPGSAYWGEEAGFPEGDANAELLWLVDPIDGTSNFRFGLPLWGVSIGLMVRGKLVAGGIILPDLGETYVAAECLGATLNGVRLPAMKAGPIEPYELISVSENLLKKHPKLAWPGKIRLSGAFVVDGSYVASGRFRGLIGRREKLYDAAASVVLAREVGGVVTHADGSEWNEADYVSDQNLERPWMIFPANSGWTLSERA